MNILLGCEFSGVVREAFRVRGHSAWSNDLIPAVDGSRYHIVGDVLEIGKLPFWDMAICFPPCTHLAVSGARWFKERRREQQEAIAFVKALASLPIPRIAIENPIGVLSTLWRCPDQIIQPWQFGHGETKRTCLWLKELPKLIPTKIVAGRKPRVHFESPGMKDGLTRGQRRSVTYSGIADAMAAQWGGLDNA